MSQTLKFDFKVSSASGKNWIVLEPVDKNLNVLGDVSLTFNFAEGVTVNQAEEIAAYLNENIVSSRLLTRQNNQRILAPDQRSAV